MRVEYLSLEFLYALVYRSSKGVANPCGYEVGILWSSNEQKAITHIETYYEPRCI